MKEYPHWVKSPITALGRQAHHNPDELFGPMPPLSMKGKSFSLCLMIVWLLTAV